MGYTFPFSCQETPRQLILVEGTAPMREIYGVLSGLWKIKELDPGTGKPQVEEQLFNEHVSVPSFVERKSRKTTIQLFLSNKATCAILTAFGLSQQEREGNSQALCVRSAIPFEVRQPLSTITIRHFLESLGHRLQDKPQASSHRPIIEEILDEDPHHAAAASVSEESPAIEEEDHPASPFAKRDSEIDPGMEEKREQKQPQSSSAPSVDSKTSCSAKKKCQKILEKKKSELTPQKKSKEVPQKPTKPIKAPHAAASASSHKPKKKETQQDQKPLKPSAASSKKSAAATHELAGKTLSKREKKSKEDTTCAAAPAASKCDEPLDEKSWTHIPTSQERSAAQKLRAEEEKVRFEAAEKREELPPTREGDLANESYWYDQRVERWYNPKKNPFDDPMYRTTLGNPIQEAQNRLFHKLPLALLPVLVRYGKNFSGRSPSEEGPGRPLSFSLRGKILLPSFEVASTVGFTKNEIWGIFELTKEARGPFFHSWFNAQYVERGAQRRIMMMTAFDEPISGVRRNPYFTNCAIPAAFQIESDGSHVSHVDCFSVVVEFEGRTYYVILPRIST